MLEKGLKANHTRPIANWKAVALLHALESLGNVSWCLNLLQSYMQVTKRSRTQSRHKTHAA